MTEQPLVVLGMQSPNVRKVVIMLEELALPYELRHVAVFKGEQFTPEFLELNPLGKVPVLLDARLGRPLAESGAILFWLAEIHRGLHRPLDEISTWEAYLQLASAPAHACPWLPEAEARAGNVEGALKRYRDCVTFDPAEPQRLLDLARYLAGQHRSHEAAAMYERAAALDPDDPAIPRLIEALESAGDSAW